MTTELPVVLLIFDLGALMGGRTQVWQEYGKIGTCYVPEVVLDEIDFLTGRAPTPDQEKVAREFMRFFPKSNWVATDAQETHPAIEPGKGANQSKQTRLVVATAHCVYGLAQEKPDSLVVFVSNSQPLLKRMQALKAPNLCGISMPTLLQWLRSEERPIWVTEQLQRMIGELSLSAIRSYSRLAKQPQSVTAGRSMTAEAEVAAVDREITAATLGKVPISSAGGSSSLMRSLSTYRGRASSRSQMEVAPVPSRRPVAQPSSVMRSRHQQEDRYDTIQFRARSSKQSNGPGIVSHLINGLMALFFLSVAVIMGWRAINPVGFKKDVLPKLPQEVRQYLK